MANRFNAVGWSEKHLDDAGGFMFGFAHIRSADQGITDEEFQRGARVIQYDMPSKILLEEQLYNQYYEVLGDDEWQALIQGDDTNNRPDRFKSTRVIPDKWDTRPEIY